MGPTRPRLATGVGTGLVALTISLAPWGGIGSGEIRRFNLLVALAASAVIWGHHCGLPWLALKRHRTLALVPVVFLALASYTNFLGFHGKGQITHLHNVAHYYLGSKYFAGLGYGTVYTAIVRVEAKAVGHSLTGRAYNFKGNYLVPVGELLDASEPVQERFSDGRWADFRSDVLALREHMEARFPALLHRSTASTRRRAERSRYALAGGFLAVVSAVRIFPALLAAGLLSQALHHWRLERRFAQEHWRFAIGALTIGMLLVGATLVRPASTSEWKDFGGNIRAHMESASSNLINLTGGTRLYVGGNGRGSRVIQRAQVRLRQFSGSYSSRSSP